MNKIDKQIYGIFCSLINTGNKYFKSIDYKFKALTYEIDDRIIILAAYTSNKEDVDSNSYTTVKDICQTSSIFLDWYDPNNRCIATSDDKIRFQLIIDDKKYNVPKLDRMTLAKALDTLDSIIAEKEYKTLNSINMAFDGDESDF